MKYILSFLCTILLLQAAFSQIPTPGELTNKPVLLSGVVVHVGNGEKIENASVLIEAGQIKWVGNASEYKPSGNEEIHELQGKHLYPGFINLDNTLGLTEIDAVRATRDFDETGKLNPNVRSVIAFNCESRIIPTVRSNGILITQATPQGSLISGQSAIMQMDCWNWEDGAILQSDGIHLNWPKTYVSGGWWAEPQGLKLNEKKEKNIEVLEQLFVAAQQYTGQTPNLKLEAIQKLFSSGLNLYIHANDEYEIVESLEFAKKHKVASVVLVGGAESYKVTDYLKDNGIPVILKRVHTLPINKHDLTDQPIITAKILEENGISFALSWGGSMEAMNSRNLPFGTGQIVAAGVPYEKAVRAVTLNAATIIGIDDNYGSIEPGKSATLFVSEGDALDMASNEVVIAFINGRMINLDNPQKHLYKKYRTKYGIE